MMLLELAVLDKSLKTIDIVDTFESLIWTERYSSYGDFEIYTNVDAAILTSLRLDYYLWFKESNQTMIIEELKIESDAENGNHLLVSGRSLESILTRRIVWQQTLLQGNFQNAIKKLLEENIINPTDKTRKVDNFVFEASTNPLVTNLTIDAQFTGDNLYDVIKFLCDSQNIGFSVVLSSDNKFIFKLYGWQDRSYDQLANPYVIFSPKLENVINSDYLESNRLLKTIILVAGEGEGSARRTITVSAPSGAGTGLEKREGYRDARDVSSTIDGQELTPQEYNSQLAERGLESLLDSSFIKSFEGQVETTHLFKYGEDFFMGDVVQIANEYGIEGKARVSEIIRSQNKDGFDLYPTFVTIK